MKQKILKQNKSGITLIALVITIIVLLILAGVSIRMITGDNGILTQVQNAKEKNNKAQIKEEIELAVASSRLEERNYGKITESVLENELQKIGITNIVKSTDTGDGSTLPWTVTKDGYTFTIDADGKVTFEGNSDTTAGVEVGDLLNDENQVVGKIVSDGTGKEIPVPTGFYYVGGTEASGVVISDDPDDENYYTGQADVGTNLEGNQFVWVPVNSTIENHNMSQSATTEGGQALTSVTVSGTATSVTTERYSNLYNFEQSVTFGAPESRSYREPDILSDASSIGEAATKSGQSNPNYARIISRETGLECASVQKVAEQYVKDYNDMIKSIGTYGGFYVGRYELTGTANNPTQIKETVLNGSSLDWYDFYNVCQKFTKGTVQSTMIWGTQWDAIMNWIQSTASTTGKYVDYTNKSYTNGNIQGWGNYRTETFPYDADLDGTVEEGEIKNQNTSTTIPTGSAEYTKANNIYDLAGNYYEWTQEACGLGSRVLRGYNCSYNPNSPFYAANRSALGATSGGGYYSSRPTLYIK